MNKELISKLKSVLMRVPEPFIYPAVEFASNLLQASPKFRHQDKFHELRSDFVESFINDLEARFSNLRNYEQLLIKLIETLDM